MRLSKVPSTASGLKHIQGCVVCVKLLLIMLKQGHGIHNIQMVHCRSCACIQMPSTNYLIVVVHANSNDTVFIWAFNVAFETCTAQPH